MKTFISTNHDSEWKPGCSVVVAENIRDARKLLDLALIEADLRPSAEFPYDLVELEGPVATVLNKGSL